ncbi:DUF4389 domain-containing protein [Porticoccaceae bacterium]|nr:DUF4389 domain-containing protein [Porticoccaceae bacterium]MDB9949269.1 DUF4389 domain-containing protein [Porticoccaceae bacterium]MDB9970081.1 DUF4389 domain-containing protein [Porticoccaceae bacterium]MDC1452765.1 DUF4389 domain-containing protein [Porticoccaceae bacterium]
MSDKKISLLNANTWIRGAYMLLFGLLLVAARLIISIVVVVQFLFVLFAGSDNDNLRNLGQGLGKWVYQTLMFLTFNSQEKPFPFDEWPAVEASDGYSASQVDDIEEGEFVDAEDVVNDDIPSFTAEQPESDEDAGKTTN